MMIAQYLEESRQKVARALTIFKNHPDPLVTYKLEAEGYLVYFGAFLRWLEHSVQMTPALNSESSICCSHEDPAYHLP